MLDNIPRELLQADDLLQEGKTNEAQKLLVAFIQQNPSSELGWYMLSHVTIQENNKIECLNRVLAINPNNREARTDLARLTGDVSADGIDPAFLKNSPFEIQSDPGQAFDTNEVPPNDQVAVTDPENAAAQPVLNTPPPTGIDGLLALENTPGPMPAINHWSDRTLTQGTPVPSFQKESDPAPVSQPANTWDSVPPSLEPGGPQEPETKKRAESELSKTLLNSLIILLIGGLIIGGVYIYLTNPALLTISGFAPAAQSGAGALAAETGTPVPAAVLTETPSNTLTATVTVRPTSTPRPSATFIPPGPTLDLVMSDIQNQVSTLRGLPIKAPVYSYIMTSDRVTQLLNAAILTPDNQIRLQTRARVLTALGLIPPTYDLIQSAMNHMVDGLGGFYTPNRKQIIVLGLTFGSLERFIYSHEYDHALVDQNFNLEKIGGDDQCLLDAQRCEAVNALIEGDAQLMMYQWLAKYATAKDYHQLSTYTQPAEALPEQSPPPYTIRNLSFPYDYGMLFVKTLYDKGGWAAVNRAYTNLPLSTSQIIHPNKYLNGVKPFPVAFPSYESLLGPEWKLIDSNDLGEWNTYLILGYGTDTTAQVNDKTAAAAAAGWSGDYYQVYYDETTSQSMVVVNWMWDSPDNAKKFQRAMDTHLSKLFKGTAVNRSDGDCWEVNQQATCLFTKNSQSLWIVSPSQAQLDLLKKQFTDFP